MNPLVHDLAWTLIHFLWQGTVVALGAKVMLVLLRRHSANLRYLVALCALLVMAASVIGTFVHRRSDATRVPAVTTPESFGGSIEHNRSGAVFVAEGDPGESRATTPGTQDSAEGGIARTFDWMRMLVIGWLVGVVLLSTWRLVGLVGISRLRRGSTAAPEFLAGEFERLRASMRVTGRAAVRLSAIARVPMVVGVLRPLVLVPAAALIGLTPGQLRAILAHELAHIRRADFLVNMIQTALETLFFFHPAVWWIGATIRRERENACDDIAVEVCENEVVYARALSELAGLYNGTDSPLAMSSAGRSRGELLRRVTRVLEVRTKPAGGGWWSAAVLSLVLIMAGTVRQGSRAEPAEPGGEKVAQRGRILDREGRVLAGNGDKGRVYPFGALAAHVVGYVANGKGVVGAEGSGQEHLEGSADLRLTLDLEKQFLVERELRDAGIGRGAVVVLDSANGEVIAMASVPSFDPSVFVRSISREDFTALRQDETGPLSNRSVTAYPPGSTFKCVTALSMDRADQHYSCKGKLDSGGAVLRCWNREGHGELALSDALMHSCNCYFYHAGMETGMEQLHQTAVRCGLGSKTGIELPSEVEGLIPDDDYLRSIESKPGPIQAALLSIGQGSTTATPLQMAVLAATIGNGGTQHGASIFLGRDRGEPRAIKGVDKEVFGVVRKALWRVVNDPEGTGRRARSELITIAGKTGTAQSSYRGEREFVGQFIGFAPYEKPRYSIAVLVQNAKSGGTVCAPLAREILEGFARIDAGEEVKITPLAPAKGHTKMVE